MRIFVTRNGAKFEHITVLIEERRGRGKSVSQKHYHIEWKSTNVFQLTELVQ
jgi:hypothetical protein